MRIALLLAGIVCLLSLVGPNVTTKAGTSIDPNGRHHRFLVGCPSGSQMDPNGNCIPG